MVLDKSVYRWQTLFFIQLLYLVWFFRWGLVVFSHPLYLICLLSFRYLLVALGWRYPLGVFIWYISKRKKRTNPKIMPFETSNNQLTHFGIKRVIHSWVRWIPFWEEIKKAWRMTPVLLNFRLTWKDRNKRADLCSIWYQLVGEAFLSNSHLLSWHESFLGVEVEEMLKTHFFLLILDHLEGEKWESYFLLYLGKSGDDMHLWWKKWKFFWGKCSVVLVTICKERNRSVWWYWKNKIKQSKYYYVWVFEMGWSLYRRFFIGYDVNVLCASLCFGWPFGAFVYSLNAIVLNFIIRYCNYINFTYNKIKIKNRTRWSWNKMKFSSDSISCRP